MFKTTEVLKRTELLGQQFEVYGTPQEPLFKAKDVATLLGLTNQRDFVKRVDDDELRKLNLPGQSGETWMLTEDGLYEVLMQSRKPIAKSFKKGVKAILKEIRTNGGYLASHQDDTPEMIMARALQKYSTQILVVSKSCCTFATVTDGSCTYFAEQAVKLLTSKVGFFIAHMKDIGGCLLRKIIKALGVEIPSVTSAKWQPLFPMPTNV